MQTIVASLLKEWQKNHIAHSLYVVLLINCQKWNRKAGSRKGGFLSRGPPLWPNRSRTASSSRSFASIVTATSQLATARINSGVNENLGSSPLFWRLTLPAPGSFSPSCSPAGDTLTAVLVKIIPRFVSCVTKKTRRITFFLNASTFTCFAMILAQRSGWRSILMRWPRRICLFVLQLSIWEPTCTLRSRSCANLVNQTTFCRHSLIWFYFYFWLSVFFRFNFILLLFACWWEWYLSCSVRLPTPRCRTLPLHPRSYLVRSLLGHVSHLTRRKTKLPSW